MSRKSKLLVKRLATLGSLLRGVLSLSRAKWSIQATIEENYEFLSCR